MKAADKPIVLIADYCHELLIERLSALGFAVNYCPEYGPKEVMEAAPELTGLIVNSKVYCGEELLSAAAKLRFAARLGSGLEVFDLDDAAKRNIHCINSPEGNCDAVAEHALGMLLSMLNNIQKANHEVRSRQWLREPNRGIELSGLTVGLIAYGHTAKAFAKRLHCLGVNVMAYDKYNPPVKGDIVTDATLEQIAARAEVLSIHLPLTNETIGMINRKFLYSFSHPYYLLNTSRGKCLDTSAVMDAIDAGKILGAGLDVFENEKLDTLTQHQEEVFDRLTKCERVILTPHIAGWTHQSKRKIAEVLAAKIEGMDFRM